MKCVIVEDEKLLAMVLEKMLKEEGIEVLGWADNVDEGIRLVDELKPDVLFLDINLGDKDGFYLLSKINHKPYVVFVTAYSEYAVKAFERNAIDYILKPVSRERLKNAIDKVSKAIESKKLNENYQDFIEEKIRSMLERLSYDLSNLQKKIPIETENEIVLVNCDDIILFQASEGLTVVNLKQGILKTKTPLKEFEAKLSKDKFIRVHKSYIISINAVKKILKNYIGGLAIELINGNIIPVGRMYKENIKKIIDT
ncbi:LytR/AlgR family response regulator transcription factor [Fervidobacterium nodosum]|uniref:Two component transcriptional regulator, LytTR family n=1 Tax=Fervidobacterium nodosum (strain ATCC 35602 / DSM 5306 / Rt17-B1) TaxID=381764 RepID=A7HMG0_FERNB|nr:LytTR family DNA-binding domain-containing protein [Fervidobacterium nodosum]ABS61093.1 two component transcriptional regulator, LytTR family [Fervidobacterium nodosum Rt17-B1]